MAKSDDKSQRIPVAEVKRRASFAGDVLKIAGGTTLAQALSILATPILTRIYGPEAYGLSVLFVSITGIIGVIACLRYELAIMLPKDDDDAAGLMVVSLIFAGAVSILMIPAISLGGGTLAHLLNSPKIADYLWLVPLAVFINGMLLPLNYWISRTRQFGRLSVARVASSITATGIQLTAGFAGYASGGSLILANITGSFASALMLGWQVWRKDRRLLRRNLDRKRMVEGIRRYKKFPLIDTWSALLSTVSWQLPVFLLSSYFSSTVVGYYGLSLMVLQFPANLVGGAVSQVFFQRAAEAKHEGRLDEVVEDTVLRLAILGLFPMLLLSLIGKEAFAVVFGASWAEAGVYSQILAIWILITFVTSPISTLFSILEKQGSSLIFNIIILVMRAGALVAGGLSGNARVAVALFALVGVVTYLAAFIWFMAMAGVSCLAILKKFRRYVAYSIPLLAAVSFAKWTLTSSPIMLVLMGGLVISIYYTIVIKINSELLSPIRDSLIQKIYPKT